jgi:predicted metal-binding membrane protein
MTADWFFAALRHDRAIVLGSLTLVVGLAWAWLLLGAGIGMEAMDMGGGQMMLMLPEWSFGYGLVVFAMWAVMMVAMMLPSAAPVTLLVAGIARKRVASGGAFGTGTALFVLGYLTVWCGFAALATALQWGLDELDCASDAMAPQPDAAGS